MRVTPKILAPGLWAFCGPLIAAMLAFAPAYASAACRDMAFSGSSYTLCDVDLTDDLRLFHSGPDGVFGNFSAINDTLAPTGKRLGFAMNAGMYHPDRAPVGLLVQGGRPHSKLITTDGPGNFGLLPNGVFCVGDSFAVIESRAFAKTKPACTYATQSGPMLVIDGALHPKFLRASPSKFIRNGVGVSADGSHAVFAISNDPVNFHAFARLFRDALKLPNALYFDGKISRLYAPELGRDDIGFPMGPIIGTVVSKG
jgi:uncharacterized protein YigE (DUF2233 family)